MHIEEDERSSGRNAFLNRGREAMRQIWCRSNGELDNYVVGEGLRNCGKVDGEYL
jgi:hypothetical protein